jgi:hypothetical protein
VRFSCAASNVNVSFHAMAEQQGSTSLWKLECGSGVPSVFSHAMESKQKKRKTETKQRQQQRPAPLISLVTDVNPRVTKELTHGTTIVIAAVAVTIILWIPTEAIQCDLASSSSSLGQDRWTLFVQSSVRCCNSPIPKWEDCMVKPWRCARKTRGDRAVEQSQPN